MDAIIQLAKNAIDVNSKFAIFLNNLYNQPSFKDFIVELNTEVQLYEQGVNNIGVSLDSISGGYSTVTIGLKKAKGQRTDHVTLKDSGRLYKTFKVNVDQDEFDIEADLSLYDGFHFKKYAFEGFGSGEQQIIGLTDESVEKVLQKIEGSLQEAMVEILLDGL